MLGWSARFPCFMPVNLDCPVHGSENMFVYGLGSGVPYPWQEILMGMLAGDVWILSNYVIYQLTLSPEKHRLDQLVSLLLLPLRLAASTTRRQCRSFRHLGQMPPRNRPVASSRALYNNPLQPPSEGRAAAKVICL